MQADLKDSIAQAAISLVMKKGVKRLTVKDIVEECHITRQAFYYHFEDIPALFQWILERDSEQTLLEAKTMKNGEEKLRYLFLLAINALPYMKKGMETNYRYELEKMLTQYAMRKRKNYSQPIRFGGKHRSGYRRLSKEKRRSFRQGKMGGFLP